MSKISTSLRLALEESLEVFIENESQYTHWPDIYVSDNLSQLMADAAQVVLESQISHEKYCLEQEYLKK